MRHFSRARWISLSTAALFLLLASATAQAPPAAVGKYIGPGGCAAASCHGSVPAKTTTRVLQNEYTVWIGQDKHAHSFAVLSNPVSVRMGHILKLEKPPSEESKCLLCHALLVPADKRAQSFELGDGVSCESCHGPASGWLGQHTIKDWPHQKSVAELGMVDLRDYAHRTERCLTCHIGTAEKYVDHEMIAAGHPDLTFELDVFSSSMPRHWKASQDDGWHLVQAWAQGSSVQLRESLQRLSRRAAAPNWPEFAELDCFACHHSLTSPEDSWRQESWAKESWYQDLAQQEKQVAQGGGTPRTAPWNQSRNAVLESVAQEIAPEEAKQLSDEMKKLDSFVSSEVASKSEISAAANRASGLADQLARRAASQNYDRALTLKIMRRITQDETLPAMGERTAEQATFCLDQLFTAYDEDAKPANSSDVRAAIKALYQMFDNPSAYSAPRFAAQLKRVGALLE